MRKLIDFLGVVAPAVVMGLTVGVICTLEAHAQGIINIWSLL